MIDRNEGLTRWGRAESLVQVFESMKYAAGNVRMLRLLMSPSALCFAMEKGTS